MTFLKALLGVAAVTVLSGHVAPSVDDNNRYLKVTPMRDGIRFAYTVFFGEIPGASERGRIDANGDGRIDDGEAKRFADKLAAEVAGAVDIETDGTAQRVQWSTISPGMGSDRVGAGSFSIDLIAMLCTRAGTNKHAIRVRDQFRIPRPGETEIRVEDSPGVSIDRARVGPADDPTHDFRFAGPGGPLSDDGLELEYTTSDATPAGACTNPPAAPHRRAPVPWPYIIAICVLGISAGLLIFSGRRRAAR